MQSNGYGQSAFNSRKHKVELIIMENREEAFHNVSVIKAISIQLTLKTVVLIKKDEASV